MHIDRILHLPIIAMMITFGFFSQSFADTPLKKIHLTGMGSLEAGQVVKGENAFNDMDGDPNVSHVWYERFIYHIGAQADIGDRAKVTVIGEQIVTYSWYRKLKVTNDYSDTKPRYLFYPHQIEGTYCFGNIDKPFLTLGVGIFPYKYNPDVRNLGEYLFRSGTYPQYLINDFDFAASRLTGLRCSFSFFDSLHITGMLLNENDMVPYNDYGLAFLGDYTIAKAVTFGAGVFFSHLFSVNERYTTPRLADNMYQIDSTHTSTGTVYDTSFYTFRGTKLMGRVSFDPKALFPNNNIFGKNDLRLYSEADIMGLTNYPVYYNDIWRRIPIIVGFNFPTFNFLNVCSIEAEFYQNKYPDSYWKVMHFENLPLPGNNSDSTVPYDYKANSIKWSVYLQKQFGNHFSITGQVSKDHWRLFRHYYVRNDLEESMHKLGDWGWILKTAWEF